MKPAELSRVAEAAGMDVLTRAAVEPVYGTPIPYAGYRVVPLTLQIFEDFRVSGALWEPADEGPHPAVILAHGHFGQGKSSGEVQVPAHALAANGYVVLALDTPGVEEGYREDRWIHLAEGAHNRHLLGAAGTSAMALQLHGLQAGLDLLEQRGDVSKIGATGASGGAVQSYYLSFVDPRVDAVALASYVPMPHEARAGGCTCDALPGWPGPDPALIAASPKPSLWLSELEQPKPKGLPRSGSFEVVAGPHGYSDEMVGEMLEFFSDELGGGDTLVTGVHTAQGALTSTDLGAAGIDDLVRDLSVGSLRGPLPAAGEYTIACTGRGPTLLVAGEIDATLVREAGFEACVVDVPLTEVDHAEALIRRDPALDVVAAGLSTAYARKGAVGVVAHRGWGLAAERAGLDHVWLDPLEDLDDLVASDPLWVHAPGMWWNPRGLHSKARGSELGPLLDAMRPRPEEDPPSPP